MRIPTSYISILTDGYFRYLWLAQIASQISINMLAFVLALRVYETTSSNTAVSLVLLTIALPAILFGFFAGVYVDRQNKKSIMLYCNLLRAVAVLGFFISSETIFWVYFLTASISIITQFFIPAEAPTIPLLVKKNYLMSANSLFTFTIYTSMILGFILAGPALKILGSHNVFLLITSLFLLATYFILKLPDLSDNKKGIKLFIELDFKGIINDFLEGLRYVLNQAKTKEALLLLTASQALITVLAGLAPGFADKVLKIDITDSSFILLLPAALGMIIGALWVGSFGYRYKQKNLINFGIVGTGFLLLLLTLCVRIERYPYFIFRIEKFLPPSFHFGVLEAILLIIFLLGWVNALINVSCNTILQRETSKKLQGRIYGVLSSLVGGAAILPLICAGVLADLFGVAKVIFVLSILILSYGLYKSLS